MLTGTYDYNIDGKNRVFVPAKFREIMGDEYMCKLCFSKFPSVQLYKKSDYLALFPKKEVDVKNPVADRFARARRNMGSAEATCDGQGRIMINPYIASLAKLEKQCIFVGFETYVEIMSPETYENFMMSLYSDGIEEEEAYLEEERTLRKMKAQGAFIETPNLCKGGKENE